MGPAAFEMGKDKSDTSKRIVPIDVTDDGKVKFFSIKGKKDAERFHFKFENEEIKKTDKMSVIYSEVEYKSTLDDNIGKTSFDIWIKQKK